MTFFGISSIKTFMAVLERISSVFAMEEYKAVREKDVHPDDVREVLVHATVVGPANPDRLDKIFAQGLLSGGTTKRPQRLLVWPMA